MTDDVHATLNAVVHAAGSVVDGFLGSASTVDDSVDDTEVPGYLHRERCIRCR